jgi:hypothetical protein
VAVGKYTVAKEFHKQTGFKFFHNHHTVDLAREIFPRETFEINSLVEKLRFLIFKEIAKSKISVVTTHTHSSDYVSKTGLSDNQYMKQIERIITKVGGSCYFIHLTADDKVIIKRTTGKSRYACGKLKDPKITRQLLKELDFKTSAPVKNNFGIDTTKLSPKQVVKIVRKHVNV